MGRIVPPQSPCRLDAIALRQVIERETLPRFLSYYERFTEYGFWAVSEKSTGDFLGWFHFRPQEEDTSNEVELGYRLHKFAWGKGYGTEGSCALVHRGFTISGVERIVASTMAVNRASRRVMEKAGLTLVRTFHETWPDVIEGSDQGEVEYALLKADWVRQQAVKAELHGMTQ